MKATLIHSSEYATAGLRKASNPGTVTGEIPLGECATRRDLRAAVRSIPPLDDPRGWRVAWEGDAWLIEVDDLLLPAGEEET